MRELGLSLGVVGALLSVALVNWLVPWPTLFWAGLWLIGGGFMVSVGAGILYHVRLYAVLQPRGALPRRWYWAPTNHHHHLRDDERSWVLRWFYVGASAVGLTFLGCLAVLLASAKS